MLRYRLYLRNVPPGAPCPSERLLEVVRAKCRHDLPQGSR